LVLGPLLFININDLLEYIKHSTVRLFADDCVLYRQISDYNDTLFLQQDIYTLQTCSQDWLMNFNPSKWYLMRVTTYIETAIMLPLSGANHYKYLGIIIQLEQTC